MATVLVIVFLFGHENRRGNLVVFKNACSDVMRHSFYLFYLYIYPPNSQESDGSANT